MKRSTTLLAAAFAAMLACSVGARADEPAAAEEAAAVTAPATVAEGAAAVTAPATVA